ncbi:MAG TPA: DNA internalization-related competence protein ComEC/Rec2 [Aquabacterium sp.]|nr:DNA internalization-related competence protein ComEC/Rec2 [Aquabacterium sp.]
MLSGMGWLPWLALALSWLLGVACQLAESALHAQAVYGVAMLLSGCALIGVGRWGRVMPPWLARGRPVLVLLAVAVLAWSSTGVRAGWRWQERWSHDETDVTVQVRIDGLPQPQPDGGIRFEAVVQRWLSDVPAPPASLRLRLYADARAQMGQVTAGQVWRLVVRLHAPDGLANPGGWDATRSVFEQGVGAVGSVRSRDSLPALVAEPGSMWVAGIDRLRQHVRQAIAARVPDAHVAGVLAGLAVGDQSAIAQQDWTVFRQTGVAHVVSVSGTHVVMLGWLVAAASRRLWSRWWAGVHRWPAPEVARWLAVIVSVLYALVAGWGVPAQRTVLMMTMMAVLRSQGRRWPWPLVWAGAAMVVTMLDPWALWQPGFWLSFVAVAILMGGPSTHPGQGTHPLVDMVRTQWRVSWALTPLALVCFQQASLMGFLANLLAIPAFTLAITPLALAGVLWAPLWGWAAWLTDLTVSALTALASWPAMVWQTPVMPGWCQALVVLGGWALTRPLNWRWRLSLGPVVLLPLLCLPPGWHLVPAPARGQFDLIAADVGQGTAVLVRTARHAVLFDTGARRPAGPDMGERVLVPLLQALGVPQLDVLVISHEDSDHVGGAMSVLQSVPVKALHTSLPAAHPVLAWHRPRLGPLPHQRCEAGQHWEWDGVRFDVLHPTSDDHAAAAHQRPNARSCVLRVSTLGAHAVSALLTGDVEADGEAALLARQARGEARVDLRSTVLLAPHHGSRTSSTEAFLQAVAPVQTVVQAGARNPYGHPAPAVLKRYADLGLDWVATPTCGAYLWRSDEPPRASSDTEGGRPRLGRCWRGVARHYWDP